MEVAPEWMRPKGNPLKPVRPLVLWQDDGLSLAPGVGLEDKGPQIEAFWQFVWISSILMAIWFLDCVMQVGAHDPQPRACPLWRLMPSSLCLGVV
jgi:hypothetical protein